MGFSYFVLCEAIVRLGLSASASALDTWAGDDHAGYYGEEVFGGVSNINNSEYSAFSRLVRGYFDEALSQFPNGSIDLLHFDGRHGYEDITHDFEAWLPKISPRGVAIFHDIGERQDGFGVWKFWDEISQQFLSFSFEHEHGLGVLGVGSDLPDRVRVFFKAAARIPERIRRDYETLGAEITRLWDLRVQADELAAVKAERDRTLNVLHAEREFGASLSAQIDELHRSTSWRVTRPLRAVGSIIHRV
jgi:hypothetical protein